MEHQREVERQRIELIKWKRERRESQNKEADLVSAAATMINYSTTK
jgi:hypothetical protein